MKTTVIKILKASREAVERGERSVPLTRAEAEAQAAAAERGHEARSRGHLRRRART